MAHRPFHCLGDAARVGRVAGKSASAAGVAPPESRDPLRRLVPTPGPGPGPRVPSGHISAGARRARPARPPPNTRTRPSSPRRAVGAGGAALPCAGGTRMSPVVLFLFFRLLRPRLHATRSMGTVTVTNYRTEFRARAPHDGHNRPIKVRPGPARLGFHLLGPEQANHEAQPVWHLLVPGDFMFSSDLGHLVGVAVSWLRADTVYYTVVYALLDWAAHLPAIL